MTVSLCDELEFSSVFREYSESLYHFLYYKTGDQSLSQDLTQEAFLRMWKNCQGVSIETAKGYAFKTAKNLLLNHYEHQKVVYKFQQRDHVTHTNQDPGFEMEHKELKTKLELAIAQLPEKQREAFLLSRIEKKTYNEIAELLGISRQAVEKRIYNALDKLRTITGNLK